MLPGKSGETKSIMKKNLLSLGELTSEEILLILDLADKIKRNPLEYSAILKNKTLLMIFEKPSLRTRVSFEAGMTQMGGHAIYYNVSTSPLGKKETIEDTGKTVSKYVDIIMARLNKFEDVKKLAENSSVPVIDALSNMNHPCQILADLQTIREKKGILKRLKLAYFGDCENNVTYSLMHGCALVGMDIAVCGPQKPEFMPKKEVINQAKEIAQRIGSKVIVTSDIKEAAQNADIVYTDSWMSYHIPEEEKQERIEALIPYQVTQGVISLAKPNAIFMNCLPAARGMEQTAEVIDGPQSVVFDQAENRLHSQKAIILKLLGIK